MQKIWDEHNRKITEIDKRTKRYIRFLFIGIIIFLTIIIYFRFT